MEELTNIPYHLRSDAPPLAVCDRCHRESFYADEIDVVDGLIQPNGQPCGGKFRSRVMNKPRVPVIWGYDFSEVIGSAIVSDDGAVTFTITDPRIIELVKRDRKIEGVSLYHTPAVQSDPIPRPSVFHDFNCTHNPIQVRLTDLGDLHVIDSYRI